jgi:hypothetical protein
MGRRTVHAAPCIFAPSDLLDLFGVAFFLQADCRAELAHPQSDDSTAVKVCACLFAARDHSDAQGALYLVRIQADLRSVLTTKRLHGTWLPILRGRERLRPERLATFVHADGDRIFWVRHAYLKANHSANRAARTCDTTNPSLPRFVASNAVFCCECWVSNQQAQ